MTTVIAPETPVESRKVNTEGSGSRGGSSAATCPRCKSADSWGMSSWCPKCGYYPAVDGKRADGASWADGLGEAGATPELQTDASSSDENLLSVVPKWVWIMLGGVAAICAGSVGIRVMCDDSEASPRTWSWIQLLSGIATVITAHGCAARFAMTQDRRVRAGDVLLGWVTIWQPTLSILPQGHKRVWSVAWGFTAAVASLVFIGDHDFNRLFAVTEQAEKEDDAAGAFKKAVGSVAAAAKKKEKKAATMEEALKNIADGSEVQAFEGDLTQFPTDAETFCDVYGYLDGKDGMPSRVFLANTVSGKMKGVASVDASEIAPEALKSIAFKLAGAECDEPVAETAEQAIWVRPLARCRVLYSGRHDDGRFKNARIVSVVRQSLPDPSASKSKTTPPDRARSRKR